MIRTYPLLSIPFTILHIVTGGPRNILPGVIMCGLFGATGQYLYNRADARNTQLAENGEIPPKHSLLNSKWSPVKVLSDKEYEDMISEKLTSIDAEIAMVDERIQALRAREREEATKNDSASKLI